MNAHDLAEIQTLIESGEYPQAVARLRQLLAVAPDDAEAHFFSASYI